jgi:hypothetical protein
MPQGNNLGPLMCTLFGAGTPEPAQAGYTLTVIIRDVGVIAFVILSPTGEDCGTDRRSHIPKPPEQPGPSARRS